MFKKLEFGRGMIPVAACAVRNDEVNDQLDESLKYWISNCRLGGRFCICWRPAVPLARFETAESAFLVRISF